MATTSAVYDFSWTASTSLVGNYITDYILTVNDGSSVQTITVYGLTQEVVVNEGANVHAEIYAVDNVGNQGFVSVLDFVATNDPRPSAPGSFGATFVRFQ